MLWVAFVNAQTKNWKFPLDRQDKNDKYVMIIAHRGDWRNAPENSLEAFRNCIKAGIDGIEIDVQETKDGELIIMHDETVNRTTNGKGKVADFTLEQIKSLYLKSGINTLTRHRIPTLAEVFELCKGKILLHIDKWEPIKDKILALGKQYNCLDQLIFRSTASSSTMKKLFGEDLEKINYIPVITANNETDIIKLQDYLTNISVSCIGIAFNRDDYKILQMIPTIREKGIRIWCNTLVGKKFNGGRDDDMAITDPDNSYGWMLEKGVSAIMTDRPFLLLEYLKKHNRR